MPVHQFPVLIHVYTVVISLPMVALLMFLMIRLSKSCVRSSTQLSIHCWAYILYFLTGFGHAFYVLVNWRSVDYLYNEPAFQLTIVLHLSFVILLPWAVLLATVDRCISLRLPTYYSAFNGESIRFLTIILSICMILGALCYIYKLVIRVDAYGSCSLVECLEISQFIHMFIVYKVFFGCVNFFVSSVFIYLFWNYQRRGRGLDKIKNNLMLIISVFEFIFNVMPPLAYYILDTYFKYDQIDLINMMAPMIFACVNVDGVFTVLLYIGTYKKRQKQFHQCKPSTRMNPIKSIQLIRQSSMKSLRSIKAKDQPSTVSRAVSS